MSDMESITLGTDLTKLLECKFPIISAPMAGVSDQVAITVSLSGGFGFIGSIHHQSKNNVTSDELSDLTYRALDHQLTQIRKSFLEQLYSSPCSNFKGLLTDDSILPLGFGIFCWKFDGFLDEEGDEDGTKRKFLKRYMTKIVENVRCVWLAFSERRLSDWINLTHEVIISRSSSTVTSSKNQIAVQVTSEQDVIELISTGSIRKVDILVLQGSESGGHGAIEGVPLISFVPMALEHLRNSKIDIGQLPVIVGAGGLVDGKHLAAMLALGTSGIACGTRFLLTPEAKISIDQKQSLLKATFKDTIRTAIFDELRQTKGWPSGIDGRALKNQSITDYENGLKIEELIERYEESNKVGDSSRVVTWCGGSIGSIKDIKTVQEIIEGIMTESIESINNTHKLILPKSSYLK